MAAFGDFTQVNKFKYSKVFSVSVRDLAFLLS